VRNSTTTLSTRWLLSYLAERGSDFIGEFQAYQEKQASTFQGDLDPREPLWSCTLRHRGGFFGYTTFNKAIGTMLADEFGSGSDLSALSAKAFNTEYVSGPASRSFARTCEYWSLVKFGVYTRVGQS